MNTTLKSLTPVAALLALSLGTATTMATQAHAGPADKMTSSEGKCGAGEKKMAEGKCGEGKCGVKADDKKAMGEGKCGAADAGKKGSAEGKCGEGKCGGGH